MDTLSSWAIILILAILIVGCDENLSPIGGIDEPFTLYGVLSPELDTQSVQLFATRDDLNASRSGKLEVLVESVDIQSGEYGRTRL